MQLRKQDLTTKIILLGFFFNLLAIFFSEGYHRPDEHLGIMRFVGVHLGMVQESILSWEFPAQIRTWSQPSLYLIVAKVLSIVHIENPFQLALSFRFISSMIAFLASGALFVSIIPHLRNKLEKNLLAFGLFLTWYLPFFHARTSSENLSISFFLGALAIIIEIIPNKQLFHQALHNRYPAVIKLPHIRLIIVSFLLALSFHIRFQSVFMIAPLIFWMKLYLKISWRHFLKIILLILASFLVLSLIDAFFYGNWVFTPWNYFDHNIFRGRASSFGISPWYYYFEKVFLKGVPPFSLLILFSFFYLWIRSPGNLFTWITLPFFIIHCFIGHKELRFIFPMGYFYIFGFIFWIRQYENYFFKSNWIKKLFSLGIIINLIWLIPSTLKPAFSQIGLYKFLYYQESPPSKLYTFGVFRDQLQFYLQKPILQIPVTEKRQKDLDLLLKENQEDIQWILLDKLEDYQVLNSSDKCQKKWSSYPHWIVKKVVQLGKKKFKNWVLFRCKKSPI